MQLDRIDSIIDKLTEVSTDLKSMLAVHEERINRQEKETDDLHAIMEKRRIEFDTKIDDVYNNMHKKDDKLIEEIKYIRDDNTSQHKEMSQKIANMEKFIWMAIGGGITVSWLITFSLNFFKIGN
jgi:hypothetical protein